MTAGINPFIRWVLSAVFYIWGRMYKLMFGCFGRNYVILGYGLDDINELERN